MQALLLPGTRRVLTRATLRSWSLFFSHAHAPHPTLNNSTALTSRYAHDELMLRKDFVLAAVGRHWRALGFAPKEFRSDAEVVLAGAAQTGHALEFAAGGLRGDPEFMVACVAKHPAALTYASERLLRDRTFLRACVGCSSLVMQHLPEAMRRDRDVVLAAVTHHWHAVRERNKKPSSHSSLHA